MTTKEKAVPVARTAFKRKSTQTHYTSTGGQGQGRFDRSRLPDPSAYYQGVFSDLRQRSSRAKVRCIFHEERSASMTLYLADGSFHCYGCGAHGRDVLDFHRRRYGLDFKAAAQDLGAWDTDHPPQRRQTTGPTTGQLIKAFRHWENGEYWRLAAFYRVINNVLATIKADTDLERVGRLYHLLGPLEQRLDILSGHDERAKLELFRQEVPCA